MIAIYHLHYVRQYYAMSYILRILYRHFWRSRQFLVTTFIFVICALSLWFFAQVKEEYMYPEYPEQGWLVNTKVCKIPDLDPFDASIAEFINSPDPLHCDRRPSLTYQIETRLYLNKTLVKLLKYDIQHCQYQVLIRSDHSDDKVYHDSKTYSLTTEGTLIKHEFIKVNCFNFKNESVYTNHHAFIIPKNDDKIATQKQNERDADEEFNVILVGIDSVSRLNSIRQLSKTRQFLTKHFDTVELLGYNKVADNTFVNVVPLLTGKYVEELPWDETKADEPFDKYNFIWKDFKKLGYKTLHGEDYAAINTFNYLKKGFIRPPTDYYFRPFAIGMSEEQKLWNNDDLCFGDRAEVEILLRYLKDFIRAHRHVPHFALTFLTRLTHYSNNAAGKLDGILHEFFEELFTGELMNNTVLFFFSDHGARFGDIRNTYIGKVEERLPMAFIVLPTLFSKRYPLLARNLHTNSNRLTTPFDIYEFLLDILHFKKSRSRENSGRGVSLFSEISKERNCKTASILPHWCTCLHHRAARLSDPLVVSAADTLVKEINSRTQDFRSVCEVYTLKTIILASVVSPDESFLRFVESVNDVIDRTVRYRNTTVQAIHIQITVELVPGGAIFEGTVTSMTKESGNRVTEISRTNAYGRHGDCVNNYILRKFCHCK